MIIEIKPKLFTKKWHSWFELKLRQSLFEELQKREQELYKQLVKSGWIRRKYQ